LTKIAYQQYTVMKCSQHSGRSVLQWYKACQVYETFDVHTAFRDKTSEPRHKKL